MLPLTVSALLSFVSLCMSLSPYHCLALRDFSNLSLPSFPHMTWHRLTIKTEIGLEDTFIYLKLKT